MRWTIGNRIVLAFGVGTIGIFTLGLAAYLGAGNLYEEADLASRTRENEAQLRNLMISNLQWIQKAGGQVIDPSAKEVGVEIDPRKCAFGKWYYSEHRRELEQRAAYVSASLTSLEEPHNRQHEAAAKIDSLLKKGDRAAAAVIYLREAAPLTAKIDEILVGMKEEISKHGIGVRDVEESARLQQMMTGMLGAAFILGIIILGFFFRKTIVSLLHGTINSVSATAAEIAATITQHERTASQQAAAATETSATITELSASSRQSAEQAANAAAVAEKAGTATVQGGDATRQAVAAMGGLKDRIAAMAEQILRLGEQTGQIGSIATLVKDLSGQINMLALNAAVEAARAGEHGKGFAVVAAEVRKLADQSRKSAEQASALVADIQKSTNASIMMTEEGSRTVAEVTELAQKVAELFNSLTGMAGSVNENAQQVMLNAKQQSAAFTQVVEAITSIAAGAKETAAGISQTKVGVQKLNEVTQTLKAMV